MANFQLKLVVNKYIWKYTQCLLYCIEYFVSDYYPCQRVSSHKISLHAISRIITVFLKAFPFGRGRANCRGRGLIFGEN